MRFSRCKLTILQHSALVLLMSSVSWSLAILASRHAFDTNGTCGPPKNSLPVHINRAHQKRCESTEVYLAEPTTKVQLAQAACIEEPRRTRLTHPYRLSEDSQSTLTLIVRLK